MNQHKVLIEKILFSKIEYNLISLILLFADVFNMSTSFQIHTRALFQITVILACMQESSVHVNFLMHTKKISGSYVENCYFLHDVGDGET